MKDYFDHNEFEDFLKGSTDRFHMRPSDKVWKGISDDLNKRKRRIIWITGLFLAAFSLSGYLVVHYTNAGIGKAPVAKNGTHSEEAGIKLPPVVPFSTVRNNLTQGRNDLTDNEVADAPVTSENSEAALALAKKLSPVLRLRSHKAANRTTLMNTSYPGVAAVEDPSTFALLPGSASLNVDPSAQQSDIAKKIILKLQQIKASENAATTVTVMPSTKKISFQFFFTPTISYRTLSENKKYTATNAQGASANMAALYNVNDAVTHKPDIGVELGFSAKYAVNKSLKVKGGFQFNMSRYDVKVFNSKFTEAATFALRNGGTERSITNYTNVDDNTATSEPDWLQNLYFQVSAPIGVEFRIAGNEKTQFGIAGTLQPSYMIGNRAYMLSTDYKNYAEVPWLVRRWNINTAFETYVAYSTGHINWQVGPQIRYQLLSSFVSNYPVKENLFDFGLKVGLSLNNKVNSGLLKK